MKSFYSLTAKGIFVFAALLGTGQAMAGASSDGHEKACLKYYGFDPSENGNNIREYACLLAQKGAPEAQYCKAEWLATCPAGSEVPPAATRSNFGHQWGRDENFSGTTAEGAAISCTYEPYNYSCVFNPKSTQVFSHNLPSPTIKVPCSLSVAGHSAHCSGNGYYGTQTFYIYSSVANSGLVACERNILYGDSFDKNMTCGEVNNIENGIFPADVTSSQTLLTCGDQYGRNIFVQRALKAAAYPYVIGTLGVVVYDRSSHLKFLRDALTLDSSAGGQGVYSTTAWKFKEFYIESSQLNLPLVFKKGDTVSGTFQQGASNHTATEPLLYYSVSPDVSAVPITCIAAADSN